MKTKIIIGITCVLAFVCPVFIATSLFLNSHINEMQDQIDTRDSMIKVSHAREFEALDMLDSLQFELFKQRIYNLEKH